MLNRTNLLTIIGVSVLSLGIGLSSATAQTVEANVDKAAIVITMETFFHSVSTEDRQRFDAELAPGFYLYDAGSRFYGDTIFQAVQRLKTAGTTFSWSVTSPDVHVNGSIAWIAYVDKGTKTTPSGTVNMEWLESAFLTKEQGRWKLVFMHSTPVTP